MYNPLLLEVLHGIGYLSGVCVEESHVLSGSVFLQVRVEITARSQLLYLKWMESRTVEPLSNGHIGTDHFVHYRAVFF